MRAILSVVCAAAAVAQAARVGLDGLPADTPISQRVEALLAKMTVEEKIRQTFHPYAGPFDHLAKIYGSTGFGAATLNPLSRTMSPADEVAMRNKLQQAIISTSRLSIPVMFSNEGLHSGAKGGTVFPESVTIGSTWNTTLARAVGAVIAGAGRASGADLLFAPVINLWTDPRFGRLQEAPSSNPTLTYHIGQAWTQGLQGADNSPPFTYLGNQSVAALGKHLAAYGAALGGLNAAPADVSNRTVLDVYLKPWRGFAKVGGRGAMPAHNTIADVPCHASGWLIGDHFRQSLGFGNGVTVSDCNDIGALQDYGLADNAAERAALALKAGVDMDLQCGNEDTSWSYNSLNVSLDQGLVTEADLDEAVRHVLGHKFAAGLFDSPTTDPSAVSGLNAPAHQQLALEAAQQGTVLLQNQGSVLPLRSKGIRKIAVIGPNGGCSGSSGAGTGPPTDGCAARNNILGSYTQTSPFVNVSTVHEAMYSWGQEEGFEVSYSQGCDIDTDVVNATMQQQAVAAAQAADAVVFVGGDSLASCGEWGDRDSLDLPGTQLQLLEALIANASNVPLIVVLVHGRPATFGGPSNTLMGSFSALLSAYRPGQMGAQGIVDVLRGAVNPSGRLAQSWPRSVGQVHAGGAPFLQHIRGKWLANSRGHTVDPDGRRYDDYVDSPATPLFALGDGLSYTTYSVSSLTVDVDQAVAAQAKVSADGDVGSKTILTATATVSNTGGMAGQAVVQLYAQDPTRLGVARFWKRLVGFARVQLEPGQSRTVDIPVIVDDLAFHSAAGGSAGMAFRVAAGAYTIRVGLSSRTDTVTATANI